MVGYHIVDRSYMGRGGKGVATVTDAIGTIACGIAGYRTLAPPDISPH